MSIGVHVPRRDGRTTLAGETRRAHRRRRVSSMDGAATRADSAADCQLNDTPYVSPVVDGEPTPVLQPPLQPLLQDVVGRDGVAPTDCWLCRRSTVTGSRFWSFHHVVKVIVASRIFDVVIALCIVLSTVAVIMETYPKFKQSNLTTVDAVLTLVFIVEIFLRIFIELPMWWVYFKDFSNWFDVIVVIVASPIVVDGPSYVIALRVFRLLRLLRLFSIFSGLYVVISAFIRSLKGALYISVLVLFVLIFFAVLGTSVFGGIDDSEWGDKCAGFGTFQDSLMTLFQLITMDGWSSIMRVCQNNGYSLAWIYFVVIVILGNLVALNLFIAIVGLSLEKEIDLQEEKNASAATSEETCGVVAATTDQALTLIPSESSKVRALELMGSVTHHTLQLRALVGHDQRTAESIDLLLESVTQLSAVVRVGRTADKSDIL